MSFFRKYLPYGDFVNDGQLEYTFGVCIYLSFCLALAYFALGIGLVVNNLLQFEPFD